ncbi:MAG: TCR/Tet family MFS transporter [Flavipsychrobacter sp.]|nr:TCR/Tet family MFS transporter [Flavipsychrobacter sp.]
MRDKKSAAMGFIFITMLVDCIGLGIIIPVMPDLIKELNGGTLSEASTIGGWLTFAYASMQFVFAPILGGLSDKLGRRPVLLASLLGLGMDYLFLAMAPSLAWLFVGRVISGIFGASFTTASAYIADISEPEKRAQNFGMIGAAFGLGFIIGPVIGGLFSEWGLRAPFIAAAIFSLLNFIYGYFILPESLKKENRRPFQWKRANPLGTLANLRRYPALGGLFAAVFLLYIAGHAAQSTWTFYTEEKFHWNARWVGYSLGFVGLMIAVVQGGLIRIIIPKIGQRMSVYAGLVMYIVGFILFAFASEGWMMFAFMVPYGLGGIAGPALQGLMSNEVPANEQGELQGGLTSMMSVTSIIGPLLMTYLFAHYTAPATGVYFPGAPFLMGAVLTLISIFLAAISLKRYRVKPITPSK